MTSTAENAQKTSAQTPCKPDKKTKNRNEPREASAARPPGDKAAQRQNRKLDQVRPTRCSLSSNVFIVASLAAAS